MALFSNKKTPKAGVKEPKESKKKKKKKKESEEDVELLDMNPAFQYAPALDASLQTQSLIDEPPVQNLIQDQQAQTIDQQQVPPTDPSNLSAQVEMIDPSVVSQVVVEGSNGGQDPIVGFDPITGQPAEIDPVTGLPVGTQLANVSAQGAQTNNVSADPNAGISINQPNYNSPLAGSTESSALGPTSNGLLFPSGDSSLINNHEKVKRQLKRFNYKIINTMGKKEQGPFEAESEEDVRNFLLSQGYQVLEVKERPSSDIDIGGNRKINAANLSFCLTQLSTYLKSGITLSDAVRILAKQTNKKSLKHHFNQLVYELLKGESLSDAMEMQDPVFPKLLINMVKTAEMTGDLPAILDDMAEYYTSMDQTKKQMRSAMIYPCVVLTIAFGVLIFMLVYLVPQFTDMFKEQGAELPKLTKTIVQVSDFVKTKWFILLGSAATVIITFIICFKKIKKFRTGIQTVLMHIPVIKNVIIYNEMANFAKTFASLLNHSVFITDSMEILSKITNNEIYKSIINESLEHLAKGDSISSSFRGKWAIPVVAYEMIVTGESTGQLGAMMDKVANHFQMLHKNIIDQMKSLIEPIMICFLAVVVGIILVSIIQPMFSIYSQIK